MRAMQLNNMQLNNVEWHQIVDNLVPASTRAPSTASDLMTSISVDRPAQAQLVMK